MNYANIKYTDIANGPGVRTSVFVSGCRNACPGCFNQEAWDFCAGKDFDAGVAFQVLTSLDADYVQGLTLLGGEPLEPENQPAVADLIEQVRAQYPQKDIWLFSGFTYEELMSGATRAATDDLPRILNNIDVLVDGRWVEAEKDITLRFRGSRNQRLIDMPRTRAAGEVVLWEDEEVYSTHSM